MKFSETEMEKEKNVLVEKSIFSILINIFKYK